MTLVRIVGGKVHLLRDSTTLCGAWLPRGPRLFRPGQRGERVYVEGTVRDVTCRACLRLV